MHSTEHLVTRVLLNRFHKGAVEQFLRKLPEDESKKLQEQNVQSDAIERILHQPEEFLTRCHYSWLLSGFKHLPEELKPLILAALPENQSTKLSKHLRKQKALSTISPPVKSYLLNLFYNYLELKKPLPLPFLAQTSLTPLASLTRQELLDVIDFLGIYDLAPEVRQIVDKQRLTTIYACLTPKKQLFLRTCLPQQEKIQSSQLVLEKWRGDCEELEKMLHLRGMIRLGKALSAQDQNLVENLVHTLDTGRGEIILKNYNQKVTARITEVLTQQVLKRRVKCE